MGGSKRKIDGISPTSPPKPKRSRETLKQNTLRSRKGKGKAILGGSEGVNDDKTGESDEGLLDVEGKIRAKERKTAEVPRDRKKKTEKRKVKGGEEVAIQKGRKGKGAKGERGKGVEKDKGDCIEREDGREDRREDKEGKGGKGTYSGED